MPTHASVTLEHPTSGNKVDVDRGIAPFIYDLWLAAIDTRLSCEDNCGGRVWIQFANQSSFELFMEGAAGLDKSTDEAHRVNDAGDRWWHEHRYDDESGVAPCPPDPEAWWINLSGRLVEGQYICYPSVRFPREHLGWVHANILATAKADGVVFQ